MDLSMLMNLGYPIGLGLAAIGSGLGLGRAIGGAMEAMGRQPEAIPKIQTAMIIGCAFAEALTIYALISVFLMPKPWENAPAAEEAMLQRPAIERTYVAEAAPVEIVYETLDIRA